MPRNKLPTHIPQTRQIRVVGIHKRTQLPNTLPDEPQKIIPRHVCIIKVGIFDQEVPYPGYPERITNTRASSIAGAGRARQQRNPSAVLREDCPRVESLEQALSYFGRQAKPGGVDDRGSSGADGALVSERVAVYDPPDLAERVEAVQARIHVRYEPIFDPVQAIAMGRRRLDDGVNLARGRVLSEFVHDLLRPVEVRHGLGHVGRCCTGEDAVVCVRVPLGDDEALTSALGAAVPVAVVGCLAIEVMDKAFGDDGLFELASVLL